MKNLKYSFFFIWSIAFLIITILGFVPSFILRPLFRDTSLPTYLIVHGVVMILWFGGYFYQSLLIARGKILNHKKQGIFWFVLAVILTLTNLYVLIAISGEAASGEVTYYNETRTAENTGLLIIGNVYLTLCSAALFLVAYVKRSTPKVHSRALFGACFFLLGPAFDRFIRPLGLMDINMFLHFSVSYIIPISLIIYDIRLYKKPRRITVIIMLLIILTIPFVFTAFNFGFHEYLIKLLG